MTIGKTFNTISSVYKKSAAAADLFFTGVAFLTCSLAVWFVLLTPLILAVIEIGNYFWSE